MALRLPSIPYPPAHEDGYWAPRTSTLDWCEENYYLTPYAAEITNTLTNILFLLLGLVGISSCIRNGHDRIFLVTFLGYMLVGTGSFTFHATLKYPAQLVDELGMIYTTCLMFWAAFAHGRSRTVQWLLASFCVALAAFITGYYHYLQDPAFHQNAYAVLTTVVLGRTVWVMEARMRPYFRRESEKRARNGISKTSEGNGSVAATREGEGVSTISRSEQLRRDARDSQILRTMWTLIALGLSIFLGGFGIWTLDNEFCSTLRIWRHRIGLPWGILLEGHGWWHLMTGLGAYFYIVWGIWLRHCLNGSQDEFELVWPSFWTSIPRVERARSYGGGRGGGAASWELNGHAKKTR